MSKKSGLPSSKKATWMEVNDKKHKKITRKIEKLSKMADILESFVVRETSAGDFIIAIHGGTDYLGGSIHIFDGYSQRPAFVDRWGCVRGGEMEAEWCGGRKGEVFKSFDSAFSDWMKLYAEGKRGHRIYKVGDGGRVVSSIGADQLFPEKPNDGA